MNPLLLGALVKGAVEIFTSKKAFKENLKSGSTIASTLPALAGIESVSSAGLVPVDNMEAAITQLVSGLLFIGLFLWRRYQNTH